MKEFLLGLINYILKLIINEDKKEIEEPILEQIEEPKEPEVITPPAIIEQPVETPKEPLKEVYTMLSLKERQTYLKKIGLYTNGIDGVIGTGSKRSIKQFNIIFLNKKSETYTEETDKLLRVIYSSYVSSKYMQNSDWQYFKNFKKSELKCKCVAQGYHNCNGYPHEISMRLIMALQYVRNSFNKSVGINSGVRCEKHNKRVGGTSNSRHKLGQAADFYISGKSASALRAKAKELPLVTYSYDITKTAVHITSIL